MVSHGLCCNPPTRAHESAGSGRRACLSGRFELQPLADELDRFGQERGTETEGALDDAGLAADVAREVEGQGLSLDRTCGRNSLLS